MHFFKINSVKRNKDFVKKGQCGVVPANKCHFVLFIKKSSTASISKEVKNSQINCKTINKTIKNIKNQKKMQVREQ